MAANADEKLKLKALVILSSCSADTKPPLEDEILDKMGMIRIDRIRVPVNAEKTEKMERLPDT